MEEEQKKPKSTLEKISALEETVSRIERRVMSIHAPTVENLVNEINQLKMQMANIAKTVMATTGLLSEKNLIKGDDIMLKIRKMDEENSKAEIEQMIGAGFLNEADQVGSHSVVAVSVSKIDKKTGDTEVISDYTKVDLYAYADGEPTKTALIGKKEGESVEVKSNQENIFVLYTVIKTYDLSDKVINGEVPESKEN